jgi:hypothetical protein
MRIVDFARLRCVEHANNPVIRPPFGSPIVADPTFLPPRDTPDARWHLFAHSIFGIHRYVSDDGLSFERVGRVAGRGALRAFVLREPDRYVLYYERTPRFDPFRRWTSWIEAKTSTDLVRWTSPRPILGPTLAWHASGDLGRAVGNPCVVRSSEGGYALYYSAGLVRLPDCGFFEPRYVGLARGPSAFGPFEPVGDPLLRPDAADALANLGAGAMKVLALDDGLVALQNGIYLDERGHSRSAVRALASHDGLSFTALADRPLIAPDRGWKRSHVYALDARQVGGRFRVYFNARSGWHWAIGREAIGAAELV